MSPRRPHHKTAYHHGNLREELVTAALEIVRKAGPEALTLRTVAQRLGVSQTAPYRHFATKDALLAALAVDGFQALQRQIERITSRAGDNAIARYQAVATAYARFALEHPAHFKVMYGPRPEEFRSGPVAEAGRAAFTYFCSVISDCLPVHRRKKETKDPRTIAIVAWSYVHGLVTLYSGGQLPARIRPAQLVAMAGNIEVFLE